jgi:hypothetical protein
MDSYFKTSSIQQLKADQDINFCLLGRIVGPENVRTIFNVPESEYPTDIPYSIIQIANWWNQINHYIQQK